MMKPIKTNYLGMKREENDINDLDLIIFHKL
jgi:hypothetical protein